MAFATYCSIWWPCILLALSLNTLLDPNDFYFFTCRRATQWYFSPFPVRWTGRGFWCYQRGNDFYGAHVSQSQNDGIPIPFEIRAIVLVGLFWRLIYFQVLPILQLALPILLTWGAAMGSIFDLLLGTQQCGATMMNAKNQNGENECLFLFYLRYKRKQRMFRSLADDIRQNFKTGNMVTKLIIVNVAVFVVTALLFAFSKLYPFDTWIHQYLCLPARPDYFLYRPWTFITHLFIHGGVFHLLWNMVGLNLLGE